MSTLIGATAGMAMWWLMMWWPSWVWFVLMMALFTFTFATRIFADGTKPLTPNYYRWSNGLSMLVFNVFPNALSVVVIDAVVDHLGAWRLLSARHEDDRSDQVLSTAD